MNILRGLGRGSHMAGASVHNQRIERLWRDVYTQVLDPFYQEFYRLEDRNLLSPDNDCDKLALKLVYGTLINERLQSFASAWNDHKLRTTNMTPNQMFMTGMLTSNDLHVTEAFTDSRSILDRIDDQMQTAFGINVAADRNVPIDTSSQDFQPPESLGADKIELLRDVVLVGSSSIEKYYLCRFMLQLL